MLEGSSRLARAALLAVGVAMGPTLAHANLITNPGFETGDLTGWVEGGNVGFTGAQPTSVYVHAGIYSAFTGGYLSPSTLSQTFIAPPNASLNIAFWLSNEALYPPPVYQSFMIVSLNDIELFSLYDSDNFDFTEFAFSATGSATGINTLTFTSEHDQAFFGLDDVSVVVTSVPEPASLALLGAGLLGLVSACRRRRVSDAGKPDARDHGVRHMPHSLAAVAAALLLAAAVPVHAAPLPAGWATNGNAGSFLSADGVVSLPPTGGNYLWAVSNGGPDGGGALPLGAPGDEASGTTVLSPFFSVQAGDEFRAWFTYLSSVPFALSDYVWAALYTSGGVFDRYLFLAQGSTVPGLGMPAIGTGVTTAPSAYVVEGVSPMFSPLGAHGCYDLQCGQIPWVETSYVFPVAGDFQVRFGASDLNLADYFPVGLAMALPAEGPGLAVPPGGAVPVPEPASLALLGAGLAGMLAVRRRRRG